MESKRILVTGLTLCCNRGGPAMAISFMKQISQYLPTEFIFSVNPSYIELENKWAKQYGVQVVENDTILDHISLKIPGTAEIQKLLKKQKSIFDNIHNDKYLKKKRHNEYQTVFENIDCVINLNGIAFVGDGTRTWISALVERTSSLYAKKHKKPFFRFIQSYGPFNDWRVRLLAKTEFANLPIIMARGGLSANYCKRIARDKLIYSFPDVAITLKPASNKWLSKYLNQFHLATGEYIVLSPSATIASMTSSIDSSLGSKHITVFSNLAKYYISKQMPILFVPHTTSPIPANCDRKICEQAVQRLNQKGTNTCSIHIIIDELNCQELKALISGAHLAIVSRYHALVASLSTGVPAISIGWNDKYQDLLDFYNASSYAVDARKGNPSNITREVIQKADSWTRQQILQLTERQRALEKMVNQASKMCADWIIKVTN